MRSRFALALARFLCVACAIGTWGVFPARAQDDAGPPPPGKLVHVTVAPVTVHAGAGMTSARLALTILSGWHINANPPSPDYMVPTEVAIDPADGVSFGNAKYPAGRPLKLSFDDNPLSVYDQQVTIELPLAASAQAANGAHAIQGQLRFQACNNQVCIAPVSVPFTVNVTVTGGVAAAVKTPAASGASPAHATRAGPDSDTTSVARGGAAAGDASGTPGAGTPAGSGLVTAPPAGAGAGTAPANRASLNNPLARALDRGGFAAFLTLFLIGLALNLTPCVYPMLGVTVSIFGARRAAPPLQVFGLALVYVLGMASMYSALGMVAAFTGGLFGAFLQNPLVLVGIGVLLAAMALSMFGLYEIQLPAGLRERASAVQATSVAGVFLSGLAVGVFAAPCVGPPVVALLAIVGAKADPWFGFTSFFTLALGLGLPYLVLGTFSNLLQTLPRSGDWMEWVKKLFGTILLAIAAFYIVLGLAPDVATWVVPIALVAGGIYLGFIDTHADWKTIKIKKAPPPAQVEGMPVATPAIEGTPPPAPAAPLRRRTPMYWFKRVGGAAAVAFGIALVATAPRAGMTFQPFTRASLDSALRDGRVVMVDFAADWCVPCHELERSTFTDPRVIAASKRFATFKADLTRYDAPESEAWRKQYGITGVPTVVFLTPDGREVFASRVEGFLAPDRFLERMAAAARAGGAVAARP